MIYYIIRGKTVKTGLFGTFRVLIFNILNFSVWKFHVGTVVTGKLTEKIYIYVTETLKTLNIVSVVFYFEG